MSQVVLVSTGLLMALLVAGCGTLSGTSSASQTPDEVERLRQRILELERQSRVYEVENARLKQQLEEARVQLEEVRPGNVQDSGARYGDVRQGRPADITTTSPSTSTPERDPVSPAPPIPPIEESDIEESDIADTEMLPSPSEVALPPVDTPPVMELDPVGAEAQKLYDSAYTFFHQKDYRGAERAFQSFLDRYPATDLSDNALFWVGESRYALGLYEQALQAFYETVERYPTGNKVADAMLKAGKSLEAMDELAQARETYQEVIERFPDSTASMAAQDRLDQLP